MPSAFGVFAAHKMTGAGTLMPDLAGSGDLKPFAQTFVCFLFWHFKQSIRDSGNLKRNSIYCLWLRVNTKDCEIH